MDTRKLYDTIGNLANELGTLNAEYDSLLNLLARLRDGVVKPEQLQVNLAARTWTLIPAAAPPVA